jgi:PIN domain nuclease of toxin-antitoxin system
VPNVVAISRPDVTALIEKAAKKMARKTEAAVALAMSVCSTTTRKRALCSGLTAEHRDRDPADRLLVATAIELACPLVTYDEHVLRFAAGYGRQYGFAANA